MFRQIKEMKTMLEGAPDLVEQTQILGAQAQRLAMAQAARQAQVEWTYAQAGEDEPIAGVSLEQYAAISKHAASSGHDPEKMAELAEVQGISPLDWQAAVSGWNARLRADAAVARRFNLRYREG